MNAGRRNSQRPRHSLLHFLLWASLSSLRIPDCASTSTTNDNDEGRNHSLAHHHLFHEIDFLAKQSMIMGDVHARNDLGTRLRFLEKSILIELEYMIILDKMISNPDEILSAYNANNAAKTHQKNTSNEAKNHQKKTPTTLGERIADTISSASWPSMASPPQSKFSDSSFKLDHEYDYDWSSRNGYLDMYNNLDCWYHARDQNKPIYTPEMWDLLWEAFRKSTLFSFPSDECPKEPFYAAYTKDDKGRGAFATRKITNGSLVHAGYPNTVFFLDKKSWFRFVSLLPKMFACDVMEFVWTQDLTDSGNIVLCLNLDEAAFLNNGGEVVPDIDVDLYEYSSNIEVKSLSSLDFYAVRDIQIHQEIMYEYDRFDFDTEGMNL